MMEKPDLDDVAKVVPEAGGLREIGAGGFKVVYQAEVGGRTEAVKLVRIPIDQSDESVREENLRRIQREIEILRKCATPFLVKLGSVDPRECVIRNEAYVVYSEEFVPGHSLRDLIQESRRPMVEQLAEVGKCLLHAVHELALMNLIHRDIKPDNIMETGIESRPYVLLDLGIAFQVGGTPLTRDTGRIPGTLYYLAPEMLDVGFRQSLDYRADLYTIGLTLYEFASGENPFMRRTDPQFTTLYRIKTVTPRPLREHRPDLPTGFCALVDQLMKKLPALRPASIPALLKRMEGIR